MFVFKVMETLQDSFFRWALMRFFTADNIERCSTLAYINYFRRHTKHIKKSLWGNSCWHTTSHLYLLHSDTNRKNVQISIATTSNTHYESRHLRKWCIFTPKSFISFWNSSPPKERFIRSCWFRLFGSYNAMLMKISGAI